MIWFTADTHFGHQAILAHQGRPFGSLAEHDAALIRNINSLVRPGDTLYHIGDFAWHDIAGYRRRLHCKQIHLVLGNHDRLKSGDAELFTSISDIKKVKIDGQKIYLCHYAMRVWNCSHHGSWHLYGHSHGNLSDDPHALSIDAGIDCHQYFPISYYAVAQIMGTKTWLPVDHHSPKTMTCWEEAS